MARIDSSDSTPDAPGAGAVALGDGGLLFVAGEGQLSTFPLSRDEVVIGRSSSCDVVVDHPSLSRRHVTLRVGPPLTVQDLGSTNGTRVARELKHGGEPMVIAVGESFHVGNFSFVVVKAPRSRSRSLSGRNDPGDALRVIDPTVERTTPLVREIAESAVNVLLLGETGVGKEVLASTLHELSKRSGPFIRINCAALSATLLESELFGHEKGAFTGAAQAKPGLLEAAHGGTAFLDEVGELPAALQPKLLRAIETKEVLRVGAIRPVSIDIRFIAATNRDLPAEVAENRFRSDLYFRLDGVTLVIPPLRERRQQIAPLALDFLRAAHERLRPKAALKLSSDLLAALERYDWPGNVRELKAVLERAVLLSRGDEIGPRHLSVAATGARSERAPVAAAPADDFSAGERAERQRIVDALDAAAGNQTRAAKALGISRATLVTKLSVYRIPRPRK